MKLNPYAQKAGSMVPIDRKTGEEFNPLNFGLVRKSGTVQDSGAERLFDKNNQINASDTKEVLQKVQVLLDRLSTGHYQVDKVRTANQRSGFNEVEAEEMIRRAFANPNGEEFARLGQAMLNPIKEVIDYEGVTRKFWTSRTIKQGEVVRYDKDLYVTAVVMGEDGQTPESVVEGKYIYPPEFEISAYPTFELKDQARAQFNMLERAQDKARQAMEYQEDLAGVNLLRLGGNIINVTTFFTTFNLAAIESIRYQVERHRLTCDKMLIHRQEISDMINTLSAQVDPVTQRELLMAGYLGQIMNTMIMTTAGTDVGYPLLDPGEVLAVTEPEYLGGFGIRTELKSEPVTQFNEGRPRRGWYWYEIVCLALVHGRGIALGQKM